MLKSIVERFSEPSSYGGLAGLLGMLGVNVPPGALQYGVMALSGLCGLIAFFMRDPANR